MIRLGLAASLAISFTALVGCSYGVERNYVEIDNALARPNSYMLAVAVDYSRVQDPTGFLNTFPNGGNLRVLERKARIYIVDVDSGIIMLVAEIDDFAGIPQPKQVWVEGWRDSTLYFSIIGYGGDAHSGDDLSDERRLAYRVDADGSLQPIDGLPTDFASTQTSGPLGRPPFLKLSKGHRDIDIWIHGRPEKTGPHARFVLDDETGEPRLVVVNEINR